MIYGIIVTHGNLGREMIETAELIMGKLENIEFISNMDLSGDGLVEVITRSIKAQPGKTIFIISDMKGGSAYLASRKAVHLFPRVFFISGINIPMLLSFCTKRDSLPADKLLRALAEDAQRGIEAVFPQKKDF